MSILNNGANPAAVRQNIVDTLLRQNYKPSGPDGFRHPDGEFVTIGYAGGQLRIRRYAAADRKRTSPIVMDLATYPDTTELALFLGEHMDPKPPAPAPSFAEQMKIAKFEAAPILPESWEGQQRIEDDRQYVQVVLDHPNAKVPHRGYPGDAGADLYTSVETTIRPGTFTDIPVGIRLGLPRGYWARITGRSSTLRQRGLLVAEAVIDNGYTGPIFAGVWNLGQESAVIKVGERLSQIILHPVVAFPYDEVDDVDSFDGRGSNGFGSSGM